MCLLISLILFKRCLEFLSLEDLCESDDKSKWIRRSTGTRLNAKAALYVSLLVVKNIGHMWSVLLRHCLQALTVPPYSCKPVVVQFLFFSSVCPKFPVVIGGRSTSPAVCSNECVLKMFKGT